MSLPFEHGLAIPARDIMERVAETLATARERQRRYFAIRRTRRKLDELPDYILRDIRVSRGAFDGIATRVHERSRDGGLHSWRLLR
jgi:uncharacterized protein YjiS (DUF1127 family)